MHVLAMAEPSQLLLLRAMRTVAASDAITDVREASLIEAVSQVLGIEVDLGSLVPLTSEELRDASPTQQDGERIVQAAILTALMDGGVAPAELDAVRVIAEAMGVSEPRVHNLEQLARGRVRLMWFDLARRSFAREIFGKALEAEGPRGVWKIVGPMLGRARDPELAARYLALGELDEDTLGYAYFRFIVENELGFPGEPYAVAESGTWHDLAHVLAGFTTEAAEEVQVVSFIAGFSREDPFFWLFTIALQFHLGIKVSPYSAPEHGLFDPAKVMAAFERGAAMKLDLSAPGFDPWPWFPKKLEDVRRELGVPTR